mmetsp:Transcript_12065/g.11631  ORF Transcript_12065/g.11631 Transcript_12065/m.11631 type:complete len:81 (-) Transcript_12065:361-603(-)|eukprot:CAMPEP_0197830102 /NCGR_PEP_ID=MMETSP1437-20131217/6695_1 /TAXON_ID=49252 ORGANISM="Eucampia antarctica, Strain CCMP1452" /NCGR_SAMPLE_ID=MMETSP1437 /ASSEMBLY_ACC=CAM_ASM_001096 /LENGTH=80 /DNA_ID=CAMNT_0043432259 /DNA_START=110 /DNA_END=352 /DNA_ORIENTATION=-
MFKSIVVAALIASASAFAPAPRTFGVRSALSAEGWSPAEGEKWTENDFAADMAKIQEEAEKRIAEKIEGLMSNVEAVGKE